MKSFFSASFLLILWALTLGMGKMPGPEVPIPEIDYRATVIDDQGISTKCSHVAWDGETFFSGTRGKGTVTISFDKVKKVTSVGPGEADKTDFQITLKNGDVVAVSFENESRLTGTTAFGTYRIYAKNIKEIIFE